MKSPGSLKIYLLILSGLVYAGCENVRDPPPGNSVEGWYIGKYTYILQGKNPVDGAFYHDTMYIDTFDVQLLPWCDSIVFRNGTDSIRFRINDLHEYPASIYTSYRIKNADSLFYQSYFYSGTDADHFFSETFDFRGKKKK